MELRDQPELSSCLLISLILHNDCVDLFVTYVTKEWIVSVARSNFRLAFSLTDSQNRGRTVSSRDKMLDVAAFRQVSRTRSTCSHRL